MSLSALNPWTQHATREARQLVLSILRSRGEPVAAHDLYNLLVAQEAQTIATSPSSGSQHAAPTLTTGNTNTPVPPHPSHVIRSMKYLRRQVLPDLMRTKDVRRVYLANEPSPEELGQRKPAGRKGNGPSSTHGVWRFECRNRPTVPKPKEEVVFGADVGIGADWSHLNKRRQRARVLSVVRDMRWLRKLETARKDVHKEGTGETPAAPAA